MHSTPIYEVCTTETRAVKDTIYATHKLYSADLPPKNEGTIHGFNHPMSKLRAPKTANRFILFQIGKVELRLVPFDDFTDPRKIARIADPVVSSKAMSSQDIYKNRRLGLANNNCMNQNVYFHSESSFCSAGKCADAEIISRHQSRVCGIFIRRKPVRFGIS